MTLFDWIAAVIVVGSMLYLTFILTIPQWISGLRKGEAVSLLPERGSRKWPLWTQILFLLLGVGLSIPLFNFFWIPFVILPPAIERLLAILGLIIYITGFGFLLWARRELGKNWGLSTGLQTKLHADHELIQSGPFACVRHPMYLGAWMFMFGLLLLYPNWFILILFISMLTSLSMRARREEAVMAKRFGEKWVEYKQRTSFIIPYLY